MTTIVGGNSPTQLHNGCSEQVKVAASTNKTSTTVDTFEFKSVKYQ